MKLSLKPLAQPRDAEYTLKKVCHGIWRAGYAKAAPWVVPAREGPPPL